MIYQAWILIILLTGGCVALVVRAIVVASRGTINTPLFHNQEQFVATDPIVQTLPNRKTKNSHWFIHTFMRSRRKG